MQRIMPHIRTWILVVLCLLGGYNMSPAQVINGHFDQSTPPGGGCPAAVWAWVEGPVPGSIQWENRYDYGNWWLDITGCGWGNGRWIEQGVPTVIGQVYHLTFDLGCWNGQYHTDAGAILTVNGVPQGRYAHTTFTGTATEPLAWKKFDYCFTATTSITTIRFTADGAPTYASPPGTTVANVGVIGLDNVKMQKDLDSLFTLDYTRSGCSYCFSLINPFAPQAPRPYASNIEWYLNNALVQYGDTTYCVDLRPGTTYQVKVIFTVNDECGSYVDTLEKTVTADYMIQDGGMVNLVAECGSPAIYTPGCSAPFDRFEITGPSYSFSGPLPAPPLSLYAGVYDLVCYDDAHCTKMHTRIIVNNSGAIRQTVCTLSLENCDQLNDERFISDALHASCPECAEVVAAATSIGELVPVSYDPVSMRWIVTREYYDEANCRKCIVTFLVPLRETICELEVDCSALRDEVLLEQLNAKCPECGTTAMNATWTGPLKLGYYDYDRRVQVMSREYIDAKSCSICRVTILVHMEESICEIKLDNCEQLRDPKLLERMIKEQCPDCDARADGREVIVRELNPVYDKEGRLVITREYFDLERCKKCVIRFVLDRVSVPEVTFSAKDGCVTLSKDELISCLHGRRIKVIPYFGEPGKGGFIPPVVYEADELIRLCCDEKGRNAYYLYAEEDPCCAMIVRLDCSSTPAADGKSTGKVMSQLPELKLVPNPAASVFRIASAAAREEYRQVEVLDMSGKVLLLRTDADSQTQIDISKYSAGVYSVKVTTATGQVIALKLTLVK